MAGTEALGKGEVRVCIVLWKLCVTNTSPPAGSQIRVTVWLYSCKTWPKNETF